jgi:hypothetical protein
MTRISVNGWEPGHLSFSTINSYRMCGKKLELQKILRLEEKPGLAAIGGNAVHVCTEEYDLGLWKPEGGSSSVELDNVRAKADTGSTDEGSAA